MTVRQIRCSFFTSNIYVLGCEGDESVWLIDCGNGVDKIPEGLNVKGVFLTHTHFDHIMGLNQLLNRYPDMVVYTTGEGKKDLYDSKLNLSKYHEVPFVFKGQDVRAILVGEIIELFDGVDMIAIATPGHQPSCITYKAEKYVFSGDAYIPGVRVITTLRGGNRAMAEESKSVILSILEGGMVLCPGHEDMFEFKE